jgi:hypothetical protein
LELGMCVDGWQWWLDIGPLSQKKETKSDVYREGLTLYNSMRLQHLTSSETFEGYILVRAKIRNSQ